MRILIAGGGQVAELIARRLIREGNDVTIVDADADRCRQLESLLDAQIMQGNAARVLTLRRAGVSACELFIAVTDSDEINVLSCLIAQTESRARVKVARLRTHEVKEWRRLLDQSGVKIDLIIHPETDIAERILRVIRLPGVSDIVDFADGEVRLFGMNIEKGDRLANKTLHELHEQGAPRHSLVVLVFRGQQVIIPRGNDALRDGDQIYVVATRNSFESTMEFMGLRSQRELKRAFIVGGKQIGIEIAKRLAVQGVNVRLIERDAARCEKIAGLLEKSVVINGDGRNQALLEEQNVGEADAFLTLTNDDEDNIITSLLARRLGARKIVALINRPDYLPLAQRLGVNTTVSPRLVAADRILRFVRKGWVLSVTTFRQEEAEAIELIAGERTKYVGKKLRDIRFPRGAIVGAIARSDGEVIVPRGEETIRPGDRVIFFALESVVPKLESAFLADPARVRS
ncbi:MAG: Trk system potassium transporter TrkA [Vicinamibacteria bacterium]|nr:Trk system potassium transporter TrkA [Vicinamibacteria bacterium]